MDILFRQSGHPREPTLVTRRDGVRLQVPVFGKLDPLPHDLVHYVVERELSLPDGFWGSVAEGAIFDGLSVLDGRQPPHARERSRMVQKAHHYGILFSEIMVEMAVRAVQGESLGTRPLPIESPLVPSRTLADRDALVARVLPAMQAMWISWQEVPLGESLLVVWSDRPTRRIRRSPPSRR